MDEYPPEAQEFLQQAPRPDTPDLPVLDYNNFPNLHASTLPQRAPATFLSQFDKPAVAKNYNTKMAFSKAATQTKNHRSPRPPPTSRVQSLLPTKPGKATTAPASTLEVTVVHFEGLMDEHQELAIHKWALADIVHEVQAILASAFKNPIKLVSGRHPLSKPGNFIYTFSGPGLKFTNIGPYTAYLLGPFGDSGTIVPTNGWVWAQVRGVLTTNFHGQLHTPDHLLRELTTNNPALAKLAFCSSPKWQSLRVAENSERATVLFAYYDPAATTLASIDKAPVFMFAKACKLVVSGSSPSLKQCSHCWRITHNMDKCKLPPRTLQCSICGGKHHNSQHGPSCPMKHKHCGPLFDHCSCPKKCINCNKTGHTAHSRQCEHIGDHRPAPISDLPTTPHPNPQPALDADGFLPSHKPRARIIKTQEGVDTPQSRLLSGQNKFISISPDMLATPEAIQLTLAEAHIDQNTFDVEWSGDGMGAITRGQAVALTVKMGLPLTIAQTTAHISGRLKGEAARKHLAAVNTNWGGRKDDDTLATITPANYFHHTTRMTYNFPLLFLDTLSTFSEHLDVCVCVDHLYKVLSGYPRHMWPRLLHAVDISSNGTGDTSTL